MKSKIETAIHSALRQGATGTGQEPYEILPEGPEHKGFIPTGVDLLDKLVRKTGVKVSHRADWLPGVTYTIDDVNEHGEIVDSSMKLPFPGQFESPGAYRAAVAHELTHWTARKDVVNRGVRGMNEVERFVARLDPSLPAFVRYAGEEMTAEIGAALLLDAIGEDAEVSARAPYIGDWMRVLPEDKRADALATAELEAEAAVSWLLQRIDLTLN